MSEGLLSEDELRHLRTGKHAKRFDLKLDPLESPAINISDAEIDALIADTLAVNQSQQVETATTPAKTPQGARAKRRVAADNQAVHSHVETFAEDVSAQVPDEVPARRKTRPSGKAKVRALGIAAVIAVAFVWPWAIPLAILGVIWLVLVLFIFVGWDRMMAGLVGVYHLLEARWPSSAERYRAALDRMALRMDGLLDRLPERWSEGVYMPDFSRENLVPGAGADWPEPFDRIAAQVRQG
jgi:hypothetical protein